MTTHNSNPVVVIEVPEVVNVVDDDINQRIDNAMEKEGTQLQQQPTIDGGSMEQHLVVSFKKLRERVIIYEYLCYITSIYYSRWNKVFLIPSIIISSLLALINSNLETNQYSWLKIVNVVGNGILAFFISIQNAFKFAEKCDYFFNQKKKFTRLHNSLNNNIIGQITNLKIDQEQLLEQMREYDNLDENIQYEFPRHIIVNTREAFKGYSMPTICNGIAVLQNEVQPRRRKRYTIPDIQNENP